MKNSNSYFPNYCINYNQILHSDKDQQLPFVNGPNMAPNKSKMVDDRHLVKSKNVNNSAMD